MTAAPGAGRAARSAGRRGGRRAGGLSDRVGQRLEIVGADRRRTGLAVEPHDLPATRGGELRRVVLAQVVGVRLGVGGERADDGGRVGVDVGERGDGGATARGARASAQRAHAGERTCPRAAEPLDTHDARNAPTLSSWPSRLGVVIATGTAGARGAPSRRRTSLWSRPRRNGSTGSCSTPSSTSRSA